LCQFFSPLILFNRNRHSLLHYLSVKVLNHNRTQARLQILARVEVTNSDEQYSLLRHGINYCRKEFVL
jgi:hypothetical protein